MQIVGKARQRQTSAASFFWKNETASLDNISIVGYAASVELERHERRGKEHGRTRKRDPE